MNKTNQQAGAEPIFSEGEWVDAQDNQGDWRVGIIINSSQQTKTYKIRFDGWASKYDQIYRYGTTRLLPFRTQVYGYTGNTQQPGIRQGWQYQQKNHEQKIAKAKFFFEHIQSYTAKQINQFLRGNHYFYTDFLMSLKLTSKQQLISILNYFKITINYVPNYVQKIIDQYEEFINQINIVKQINSISSRQAIFRSYFQIFDAVYIIMGGHSRFNTFFISNHSYIRQLCNDPEQKQTKKILQKYMFKEIDKNDLFNKLYILMQKMKNKQEAVSFIFLYSFTNILNVVIHNNNEYKKKIYFLLTKILQTNLNKIKEHNFKQINIYYFQWCLNYVVNLKIDNNYTQKIKEWSISQRLKLAYKLICCPYFQKKLKGVQILIQYCTNQLRFIKTNSFSQWTQQCKLYQAIFASDNPDFIKKGCELIKIAYNRQWINKQQIELIFKSTKGKHESVIKQLYNLYAQLPKYSRSFQEKQYLFKKICQIAPQIWNKQYLHLLKQFTLNSWHNISQQQLNRMLFGFPLIYHYLLKNQENYDLFQFVQLVQIIRDTHPCKRFQTSIIQNIAKGIKILFHIKLLKLISLKKIFNAHVSENPINIIAKSLLNQIQLNTNNQNNEINKLIQDCFFIFNQLSTQYQGLSVQAFLYLWSKLMVNSYRKTFLNNICKKKQNFKHNITFCIPSKFRRQIFSRLWNKKQQRQQIDIEEFYFFVEMFKFININQKKAQRFNTTIFTFDNALQGYDKLWYIFEQTTDNKVLKLAKQFLSEIHHHSSQQIRQFFINFLVNKIQSDINLHKEENNIELIKRKLSLISCLIDLQRLQCKIILSNKSNHMKQYYIYHRNIKKQITLKLNTGIYLCEFKKRIAQRFNTTSSKIRVFNKKNQFLSYKYYFKSLNELQSNKFQLQQIIDYVSPIHLILKDKIEMIKNLLGVKQTQKQAWSILNQIQIPKHIKNQYQKKQNILQNIHKQNFYQELYGLRIIQQLSKQWWIRFSTSQNLSYLQQKISKAQLKQTIDISYISYHINIIQKCLSQGNYLQIPPRLLNSVLRLIFELVNFVNRLKKKNNQHQLKLLQDLFQSLKKIEYYIKKNDETQYNLASKIIQIQYFQQLLTEGLIKSHLISVRRTYLKYFLQIFQNIESNKFQICFQLFIKKIFNIIVEMPNTKQLKQYFLFASIILQKIQIKNPSITMNDPSLGQKLLRLLKNQQNQTANFQNTKLCGYLSLLKIFVKKQTPQNKVQISKFIVFQCLYADKPKCRSNVTISAALNILTSFFLQEGIIENILEFFSQLHKKGRQRIRKSEDWSISSTDKAKSNTGYVGLRNLGCICYINSFMQQLFMIPSFRMSIINLQQKQQKMDQNIQSTSLSQNPRDDLLYQCKKMFMNLLKSQKKFYNPKDFCYAFKDYQGNPTNITQQMDIDEFSNILFDRLQGLLRSTNNPSLIKNMFGGVFSNEIVCKGCPHFSQRQQHFLSISLTVKDKKNIYESFQTMVKGDVLDGQNAYFCQRCNKKVPAVKRVSIKTLPQHLIITLKRFQFDFQKMMKLKVNQYCQFPLQLDLKQYSRQFLRKKQNCRTSDEEQLQNDDYFKFKLKGVVVHVGEIDNGHYYSLIQQRKNGKWFQFNDMSVTKFQLDELQDEAYGQKNIGYQTRQKSRNAYILIYQRSQQNLHKMQIQQQNLSKRKDMFSILEDISRQNKDHFVELLIFSQQYANFVENILNKIPQIPLEKRQFYLKYVIIYLLTVLIRCKNQGKFNIFLQKIDQLLRSCPSVGQWLILFFSEQTRFQQYFIKNSLKDIKRSLAAWISSNINTIQIKFQRLFFNLILNKLSDLKQNNFQCCLMLYQAMTQNIETVKYLISQHIIGRLLQNVLKIQDRYYVSNLQILQQMETDAYIDLQDEYQRQMKKNKSQEHGYTWAIINLCLNYIQQKDILLRHILEDQQLQLIQLKSNSIFKILQDLKNKFHIQTFTTFLARITRNRQGRIIQIQSLIWKGLKDFQSKRYRQFFLLFQKIIKIDDQFEQLRLSGIKSLYDGLIQNDKYSLDFNIINQWIIILLNRNQSLRNFLISKYPQTLINLIQYTMKKIPNDEIASKNRVFCEHTINKLHGVKFPTNKKQYIKLCEQMTTFYKRISEQIFIPDQNWPTAPQQSSLNANLGDVIGYFDMKDTIAYQQGVITSIFLSNYEIQLKQKTINVPREDEKITLDKLMVNLQELAEQDSQKTAELKSSSDEFDQI